MPLIKIDSERVIALHTSMGQQASQIDEVQALIRKTIAEIDIKTAGAEGVYNSLRALQKRAQTQDQQLNELRNGLVKAEAMFMRTDKLISRDAKEVSYLLTNTLNGFYNSGASKSSLMMQHVGAIINVINQIFGIRSTSSVSGAINHVVKEWTERLLNFKPQGNSATEKNEEQNQPTELGFSNTKAYSYKNMNFNIVDKLSEEYLDGRFNQKNYSKFNSKNGSNVGCTATAEAFNASLNLGQDISPNDVGWTSGGCTWNYSNAYGTSIAKWTYDNPQDYLSCVASMARAGTSSIIRLTGHSVVVVGVDESANMSNLQYSDILVLDPAGGELKTLEEARHWVERGNPPLELDYGWSIRHYGNLNNAN